MKKPNRFERAAHKAVEELRQCKCCFLPMSDDYALHINGAIQRELSKEHRWVERMVKQVDAWACQELADNDDVIAAILEQLKQRRK